ncbi:MAG: metabolite traffic protein EboE, partial [Planctomycetota bacterium]|nr:metabolite traffic protein EboE [Planctomycetota bacterium]
MPIYKRFSTPVLLAYCTNVHPGESPEEVISSLTQYTLPLKKRLVPEHPMALGLRLGGAAVQALTETRQAIEPFRAFIRGTGLLPFTLNAFPYGNFHSERVKEKVFEPTWLDDERVLYTTRAARVLAALIGEGETGSLSTHTGAFRSDGNQGEVKEGLLHNLIRVVSSLHALQKESGKTIVLCLEPEPFSTLESTEEVVDFFQEHLFLEGPAILAEETGMDPRRAEEVIWTHMGVCFDTCHLSVQFENLRDAARLYRTKGIRIGKVQISNALELHEPGKNPEGVEALRRFQENKYLHQVIGRGLRGKRMQSPDLDDLFGGSLKKWLKLEKWRVHYHVPLTWDSVPPLSTTRKDIADVIPFILKENLCHHFEIETYTWGVLPDQKDQDLVTGLEEEF